MIINMQNWYVLNFFKYGITIIQIKQITTPIISIDLIEMIFNIGVNGPHAAAVRVLPGLGFRFVSHFVDTTNVYFRSFPALLAAGLLTPVLLF